MTGDLNSAKKLEVIYGPAPEGIEKCDLLVGDLYEKKLPVSIFCMDSILGAI